MRPAALLLAALAAAVGPTEARAPETLYVVAQSGGSTLLAVDPETGDRRIISGGPEDRGDGPLLYPANARPLLAGMRPPEDPQPPRRVRGRLP